MAKVLRGTLAVVAMGGVAVAFGCSSSSKTPSGPTNTTQATVGQSTTAPATTATTPSTTSTATAPAAGGVKATVQVQADPSGTLAFVQKTLSAPAGTVVFDFKNAAPVPHDFAIKDGTKLGPTAQISNGQSAQLKVTLKPGTYEFYCTVPGHEQAGMKGTLTVT